MIIQWARRTAAARAGCDTGEQAGGRRAAGREKGAEGAERAAG